MDQYYKILGLRPGASQEEVKQAYRDLVKVWHPDRFSYDLRLQQKAQEKLKEINIAHEKLSNQSAQTGAYTQKQRPDQEEGSRKQHRASETQRPRPEQETGSQEQPRSSETKETHGFKMESKGTSKISDKGAFIGVLGFILFFFFIAIIMSYYQPSKPTENSIFNSSGQKRMNPITEFKQKYPQYKDADNEVLIKRLHDKYYPEVDYNKFREFALKEREPSPQEEPDSLTKQRLSEEYRELSEPAIPNENREPSKPAAPSEPVINSAEYWFQEGDRHLVDENYDLAIRAFSKIIATNSNAETYFGRGTAYYHKKQYDKAIGDFNKAIELGLSNADTFFYRGIAYYYRSQYDEAIEDFSRAITLNSNSAAVYLFRGLALYKEGLLLSARSDFQVACSRGSEKGCTYFKEVQKNTENIKDVPEYTETH